MKSLVMIGLVLGAVNAHAEGTSLPECQNAYTVCQGAGFKAGAHQKGQKMGEGTGLWIDCVGAVAKGKKQVAGLDQAAAQACLTAHKAHKAEKAAAKK